MIDLKDLDSDIASTLGSQEGYPTPSEHLRLAFTVFAKHVNAELEKSPKPSQKVVYNAIKNYIMNDYKIRDAIQKVISDELKEGISNFLKWNDTWVRNLVRIHLGAYTAELLKTKWNVKIEPQITIQEIK